MYNIHEGGFFMLGDNVREYIFGKLDNKVQPTSEGIKKLRDILAKHIDNGEIDLKWDEEDESNSDNNKRGHDYVLWLHHAH